MTMSGNAKMLMTPTIEVLNLIQGCGNAKDDDIATLNEELGFTASGSTFDTSQYDTDGLMSMFERFADATACLESSSDNIRLNIVQSKSQIDTNDRVNLKLMEARMRFMNELNMRKMLKENFEEMEKNVHDLVDKSVKRRLTISGSERSPSPPAKRQEVETTSSSTGVVKRKDPTRCAHTDIRLNARTPPAPPARSSGRGQAEHVERLPDRANELSHLERAQGILKVNWETRRFTVYPMPTNVDIRDFQLPSEKEHYKLAVDLFKAMPIKLRTDSFRPPYTAFDLNGEEVNIRRSSVMIKGIPPNIRDTEALWPILTLFGLLPFTNTNPLFYGVNVDYKMEHRTGVEEFTGMIFLGCSTQKLAQMIVNTFNGCGDRCHEIDYPYGTRLNHATRGTPRAYLKAQLIDEPVKFRTGAGTEGGLSASTRYGEGIYDCL